MSLAAARAVADAVLYEGYLLYPYRADAVKNQVRWQFGVLGPPGAARRGVGEEPDLRAECLVRPGGDGELTVHLRFLQVQSRTAEQARDGAFVPVPSLPLDAGTWLTWDEAAEHEVVLGPFRFDGLATLDGGDAPGAATEVPVHAPGGTDVETLTSAGSVAGRLVRRREPLVGVVRVGAQRDGPVLRLRVDVANTGARVTADETAEAVVRRSFVGAHALLAVTGAAFCSLTDPPPDAADAATRCTQHRCWPALAGSPGDDDLVLASPIILGDHPQVAEQSAGALFDSTEIDEILTLRVMTMTDDEKARARATDPRAAEIVDRCDALSPEALQRLHGVLRDPHLPIGTESGGDPGANPGAEDAARQDPDVRDVAVPPPDLGGDVPWWDPAVDASVRPATDGVLVDGVRVARDSLVEVHPSRRADAQDLFFAGRTARVAAVHTDVDGSTHVAVVLLDDPAADLHDWYGRYLYFAPDELRPVVGAAGNREENRS